MWAQQKKKKPSLYIFISVSWFLRVSLWSECFACQLSSDSLTQRQPIVGKFSHSGPVLFIAVGDRTYQQLSTVCITGHIFKKRQKKSDFISCRGADKCLVLHTNVCICYLNPGILSAFILKIFRLSTNWFVLMFPHETLQLGWDNSKHREPPPLRHRLNRLLADLKCCQSKQT